MREPGKFIKSLNLFDSAAIIMGSMIGSGIFIVSADIARNVGSPGWMLVVWAITGLMTVLAALSYGELASMLPHAGGIYVYLREGYSPLFGFLYGWTLFLVIQCGTVAAIAVAFAKFAGVLFPWISEQRFLLTLGSFHVNTTQFVAILLILFLTWINTRGIREGKYVQNLFTYTKVLIMVAFVVAGLLVGMKTDFSALISGDFWQASRITDLETGSRVPIFGHTLVIAIAISMVGSIFAADAWYNVTYTSDEVINPRKTLPRSLFLGTLAVSVIYLLVNVVYVIALPVQGTPDGATVMEKGIQFATSDRVATAAIDGIFGTAAEMIMAIVVVISTFGANNGIVLSGARVVYAMAQDGLFFKKVGVLNSRGVPAVSLIIQAVWAVLLCLSGTFGQLLDYVTFAAIIFYVLTIGAVFMLRYKRPEVERPYKAFGYPIIPVIYIIACLVIIVALLIYKPLWTWPGLIILVSGVPVYYLWRWFLQKKRPFRDAVS
jgi:APA family basic amino acid/polyamine antiporter